MHDKGFYFKFFKAKQLVGSNLENCQRVFCVLWLFSSFFHFFEVATKLASEFQGFLNTIWSIYELIRFAANKVGKSSIFLH